MRLHHETVSKALHVLLKQLMQAEPLQEFHLVGGTALSLRYGHRKSVDIDLFTSAPFDAAELRIYLEEQFHLSQASSKKNTVHGQINGIKTDFIAHQYPLIGEVETIDGIRFLSIEDIAAMKLNAIANRGGKKDFWDYAHLLNHFDRETLLSFFAEKYPRSSRWNLEKSLSYFEDAESDPAPIDLSGTTWEAVKARIQRNNRLR